MTSAASQRASMRSTDGGIGTKSGSMPNTSRHSSPVRPADVRELVSTAMQRSCSIGREVKIATDATGPSEMMPMPGTIR